MRNFVEAGFDVALNDPLIGAGREVAHLGHRVVCPAVGAEPVAAREKIRLEDRLQHQLQGCLDHPIPNGRDPKAAQLAVRLGDHALPHRQRAETAVLQLRPQLIQDDLHAAHRFDIVGGLPVYPGRARTLVAPHPSPRHQQERGIGDEVEQVIKPAMRSITGPLVQLGLDLPYSLLRLRQRLLRRVGIHRRPPGLPASLLPTRWPPSPCSRLSRPPWRVVTPATTTGPPSRPAPTADDAPARPRAGCARRGRHRTVIAVGTALAGGPPHRSQRALLTHWAPALGTNAKTRVGKGMHHAGGRQPSNREAVHALPADPRALAATLKRLMPEPGHLGTKGSDRRTVAWHGVVGAVPSHHACQPPSLLRDGLIPASLELVLDRSQLGPHPLGDRDPPHPEPPVPQPRANMCEAEESKRLRLPQTPRPGRWADARVRPPRQVRRPTPLGRGLWEQVTAIAVRAPRSSSTASTASSWPPATTARRGQRRPDTHGPVTVTGTFVPTPTLSTTQVSTPAPGRSLAGRSRTIANVTRWPGPIALTRAQFSRWRSTALPALRSSTASM